MRALWIGLAAVAAVAALAACASARQAGPRPQVGSGAAAGPDSTSGAGADSIDIARADTIAGAPIDSITLGRADSIAPVQGDSMAAAGRPALPDSGIAAEGSFLLPSDSVSAPGTGRRDLGQGDEFFGRSTARGSYEIRSLATGEALGHEEWELLEDDAGFRTLRVTTELETQSMQSSRSATVTVTPELSFVAADLGSDAEGIESYATYRRAGDLLSVEAHGDGNGEVRQQVRLPEDGIFVSQVFATRGWELASFDRPEESTRPAYLSGSAPGVLIGEVKTLSARRAGQEELRLPAGVFRTLRFEIPLAGRAPDAASPGDESDGEPMQDRWWVLADSRLPAAAELPSLGIRLELSELVQGPQPAAPAARGAVLARGVYHHRLLRRTEPLAVESWTLSALPNGGYLLETEIAYADGPRVSVRALADSAFLVSELQLRRIAGPGGESTSIRIGGGELRGESRGGAVGLAEQRLTPGGPVVFRLGAAALEGWAVVAGGGTGRTPGSAGADSLPARTDTYWLPGGPHPLGVLLSLPADVDLGAERVPTPARTFSTRRWASPAETPSLFRAVRWVFEPYRLPARVLFPGLGREAILVRYETPG